MRKTENAVGLKALGGQSACGTLNRYLLIFNRLIFESRVRASSPSLAAAPAGPEIRPWLSARAASIISFSCLTRADRKSTRLNSSHANISYAVFCLKKKNKKHKLITPHGRST